MGLSGTTRASGIGWRGSEDAPSWSRRPSVWWTSASPCSPASLETTGLPTSYLCSPKTLRQGRPIGGPAFGGQLVQAPGHGHEGVEDQQVGRKVIVLDQLALLVPHALALQPALAEGDPLGVLVEQLALVGRRLDQVAQFERGQVIQHYVEYG